MPLAGGLAPKPLKDMICGLYSGWVASIINELGNQKLRDSQARDAMWQAMN